MWRRAFTLIELLTVVAIIAILAGIMLPVVVGMASKGKETSARADMNAIKLALTQFKADYAVFPVATQNNADTVYQAGFGNQPVKDADIDTLIQELTMINVKPGSNDAPDAYAPSTSTLRNTKKRKYLDAPAKPVTPKVSVNGVTRGFFKIDPWGRRYNIALDTNYDKTLTLTKNDFGIEKDETVVGEIAIYSYGAAESADDYEAFLYSWKTNAQ